MKILIDIPDTKADAFMDVLNSITFVKAKQLTESKAQALKEVRDAVVEMKQIKTGKKKSRSATEFLNEL
ncbi:MAG: hypothetical protein JNJ85_06810 [Candidatus Kapabacteria bacterium]|nr:hypothetical protein [Candidatus Kapabacteria bacterium]MBX7154631.1 hypothetical protein [Bacteroidota bacterium]